MKARNDDDIIQAFRQKIINPETGKEVPLDKKYLNTDIWVQITDPVLFKKIFPAYVHHIAEELDEWYVFVKKVNPVLNKVDDLIDLKAELVKIHESDFARLAFKTGVTSDSLSKMNYFQVRDFLIKNNVIQAEPKKKEDDNLKPKQVNQLNKKTNQTKKTENNPEDSEE